MAAQAPLPPHDEVIQESKDQENADDQKDEPEMSPQLKQYQMEGIEIKKELDRLLTTSDQFIVASDTYPEFKIQNKSFRIRQLVSYSSDTKKTTDPMIWYTETVSPGSPWMVYETWTDSTFRMQWDSQLSTARKIQIDDAFPNIYILHSSVKAAGGGLISPRDFVNLLSIHEFENNATGYKAVQIASKSIERDDVPEQNGFVRGTVYISGALFERLSEDEMKEMKLPKLTVAAKEDENADEDEKENTKECEWTRIRYIVQTDIKGWIPVSVINASMSYMNNGMMRDLRNFIIQKRLGLHETDE